jgi:hypothetical protein
MQILFAWPKKFIFSPCRWSILYVIPLPKTTLDRKFLSRISIYFILLATKVNLPLLFFFHDRVNWLHMLNSLSHQRLFEDSVLVLRTGLLKLSTGAI